MEVVSVVTFIFFLVAFKLSCLQYSVADLKICSLILLVMSSCMEIWLVWGGDVKRMPLVPI